MKLKKICVENFLSFDRFELELDDRLTVIVGPNGSGKTNLARALRMVREVIGALVGAVRGVRWADAVRRGGPAEFKVSLEVEFDREEMKLWELFFEAALLSIGPVPENPQAFNSFLKASRKARLHDRLRQSKLEVRFSGRPYNLWNVCLMGSGLGLVWDGGHTAICTKCPGQVTGPAEIDQELRQLFGPEDSAVAAENLEALIRVVEGRGYLLRFGPDLAKLPTSGKGSDLRSRLTAEFRPYNVGQHVHFLHVLDRILGRGLFVMDNVRRRPEESRLPENWDGVDLEPDGGNLGLYLFGLINGKEPERRLFSKIRQTFRKLTGRDAEVILDGDQVVKVLVCQGKLEIPAAFDGAGVWEALLLSALLAQGRGVLVLDEPALNLHPPLQRRLLGQVLGAARAGTQVVLITHSPYLVPAREDEDVRRVVRFVLDGEKKATRPCRFKVADEEAAAKDMELLRRDADVRAFLFADGVVLVEGETEAAALPIWWEAYQVDLNVVFKAVGGHTAPDRYIHLLEAWEIPWVFVVDGKDLRAALKHLRKHLGLQYEEAQIDRLSFEKAKEEAEKHGIFTLNTNDKGEFETLPFLKEFIKEAREKYRSSKPLQGRWVALQTNPPEVKEMFDKICGFFKSAGSPGPAAGQPGVTAGVTGPRRP